MKAPLRSSGRAKTGAYAKGELNATDAIARLKETGLEKLTISDVLEMLRQSGIENLERLVAAQLELARTEIDRPDAINLYAPRLETPPEQAGAIVHRIPEMPVTVDGVLYDPADISRWNGQPLHFLARPDSAGSQLEAFTGSQWTTALRAYFQVRHLMSLLDVVPASQRPLEPLDFPIPSLPTPPSFPGFPGPTPFIPLPGSPGAPHQPQPAPHSPPPPPPPPPAESQFFSDNNFGGDWLWLGRHLAWNDLTRVSRAKVLFFSSDWNDVISSVRIWAGTVTFYEHINQGGSSLTFQQGLDISDLNPYAFNDRISSIVNWG